MTCRAQFQLRSRLLSGMAIFAFSLAVGCQAKIGDSLDEQTGGNPGSATGRPGSGGSTGSPTGGPGPSTGTGAGMGTGTGTGSGGSGAGTGTGGSGGGGPSACTGTEDVAKKRLIRLTFNQIVNSIGSLFNGALATTVATTNSVPDATERTFPPLINPREGTVITDSQWSKGDAIAVQVAKHVLDNFATVTGCATATDACAQQYLGTFAERAYRRPLTADETTSVNQVYTEVKAAGGSINEGVQFGVNAILEAPQFLYRTEFGTDPKVAGPISPYEMASQLSYFIGDAPPDQPLLDAAKQGRLATAADVDAQVSRLLALETAKLNLQQAMFAYFETGRVLTIVMPDQPTFDDGTKNSMYQESVLFINNTLWGPKVNDLLTSKRTFINTRLAPIYGVAPPAGATDNDFVPFDMPATRAGILTSPAFLVSRSRPDGQSVVGRGLLVNATVLCGQNPEFNPALQGAVDEANKILAGASEREKAVYRMTNGPCNGCHQGFDPYGLSLENFDILAKFRTMDDKGRAIDASVTLPASAGGTMAKDAAEMAAQLTSNGAFAACLAKNLILFGLAEPVALTTDSCATRAVASVFTGSSDQSFAGLVRAVAASKSISTRSPGGV